MDVIGIFKPHRTVLRHQMLHLGILCGEILLTISRASVSSSA
jgi:hypothetical protein